MQFNWITNVKDQKKARKEAFSIVGRDPQKKGFLIKVQNAAPTMNNRDPVKRYI